MAAHGADGSRLDHESSNVRITSDPSKPLWKLGIDRENCHAIFVALKPFGKDAHLDRMTSQDLERRRYQSDPQTHHSDLLDGPQRVVEVEPH